MAEVLEKANKRRARGFGRLLSLRLIFSTCKSRWRGAAIQLIKIGKERTNEVLGWNCPSLYIYGLESAYQRTHMVKTMAYSRMATLLGTKLIFLEANPKRTNHLVSRSSLSQILKKLINATGHNELCPRNDSPFQFIEHNH